VITWDTLLVIGVSPHLLEGILVNLPQRTSFFLVMNYSRKDSLKGLTPDPPSTIEISFIWRVSEISESDSIFWVQSSKLYLPDFAGNVSSDSFL